MFAHQTLQVQSLHPHCGLQKPLRLKGILFGEAIL